MSVSHLPQEASPIRIKGTQDGLVITIAETLPEDWISPLEAEFAGQPDFWRGGRVVLSLGSREVGRAQLETALSLLERYGMRLYAVLAENDATKRSARELSLAVRLAGARLDLQEKVAALPVPAAAEEPEDDEAEEEPAGAPPALILKETLRSGRSVRHSGPVIVIGDVNPGAEVHASGDVIVWGKLRGLVHAGASGDPAAVVCALDLNPTQLRIADKITIPPKDARRQPVPEMAVIRDEHIVAEPWRSKA